MDKGGTFPSGNPSKSGTTYEGFVKSPESSLKIRKVKPLRQ
jgi:hypothetical protein